MKLFKRIVCMILVLASVLPLFAGCASSKTDDEIYLTKGEFFAYFVYDNSMTSEKYTPEEILACEDGSVEADVIAEWGYLTQEQASEKLDKPVDKETVVTVCAKATFNLATGDVSDIKDAAMLKEPQLIADAYASGFFELENGYFDGAQKMSFADCEQIMNNARIYTANFHYPTDTEILETAEDVAVYESADYEEGAVVIEFTGEEDVEASPTAATKSGSTVVSLVDITDSDGATLQAQQLAGLVNPLNSFNAMIRIDIFEGKLGSPKVGDTVVFSSYDALLSGYVKKQDGEIIGILQSARKSGAVYDCVFTYPDFEQAVTKRNVTEGNKGSIDPTTFVQEKEEYMGWKLEMKVTSGDILITATKDFTVYETDRKQDWQNSKKTITATASFSMNNFNVDTKNLRSFATKSGTGFVKVTYDSSMSFALSTSLRYTPDSNRNGKFPSNWSNSRWTDSDSKGAKEIKVARFSASAYGVVGAEIYVYMKISLDGKVSFTTSLEGGGVQISANNGKISTTKLGVKKDEVSATINIHARVGVDITVTIFTFINVIKYDLGLDADFKAMVNLYYEDTLSKQGVYADEEGLAQYAEDDGKFGYCIGVSLDLNLSGVLEESGVKLILNALSAGTSMDFTLDIWEKELHFEDGSFVDACSRGEDPLEESEDDDIQLDTYKLNLKVGESDLVFLKAIPNASKELLNTKNSITVKSNNNKVVTATYNKTNKLIIVEAVGEGSTEITITAKRGMLWWKKSYTQKVSVTVSANVDGTTSIIITPIPATDPAYF